jgi:hypothetical protein
LALNKQPSEFLVEKTPAFVPFLLMFAVIALAGGGFWWQDRRSELWRKEYVNPPEGTSLSPFSEIRELTKMAVVIIALCLISLIVQRIFHIG